MSDPTVKRLLLELAAAHFTCGNWRMGDEDSYAEMVREVHQVEKSLMNIFDGMESHIKELETRPDPSTETEDRYREALEEIRSRDRSSLQMGGYRKGTFGELADNALNPQNAEVKS